MWNKLILLDQLNYTKILNFFVNVLGYCYRCRTCDRRAKIISASASEFGFDYVSWECPKCMRCWGMEFKKKEIRKLLLA